MPHQERARKTHNEKVKGREEKKKHVLKIVVGRRKTIRKRLLEDHVY